MSKRVWDGAGHYSACSQNLVWWLFWFIWYEEDHYFTREAEIIIDIVHVYDFDNWLVGFCCFTSQVNSYGHCGKVSSPNHTFSWAGLNKRLTSNSCTYFRLKLTTTLLEWISEGRRMTIEIISWSISTKVWDRTGIELATPGSAVRQASVARHVTDCATQPGMTLIWFGLE